MICFLASNIEIHAFCLKPDTQVCPHDLLTPRKEILTPRVEYGVDHWDHSGVCTVSQKEVDMAEGGNCLRIGGVRHGHASICEGRPTSQPCETSTDRHPSLMRCVGYAAWGSASCARAISTVDLLDSPGSPFILISSNPSRPNHHTAALSEVPWLEH